MERIQFISSEYTFPWRKMQEITTEQNFTHRLMTKQNCHSGSDRDERSLMGQGYALFCSNQYDTPFAKGLVALGDDITGATHARCSFSPVKALKGIPSTQTVSSRGVRNEPVRCRRRQRRRCVMNDARVFFLYNGVTAQWIESIFEYARKLRN